jgi:transposase InsO family protein
MNRDLVDQGHENRRQRTAWLMRENHLIAPQKRRFKRTTDSGHAWPVAPNLVALDFTAEDPDRKLEQTSPTSGRRRAGSISRSFWTFIHGAPSVEPRVTA